MRSGLLCVLLLSLSVSLSVSEICLSHLSTKYLPFDDVDGVTSYAFNKDAAEQSAYDPTNQIVYTVGTHLLHVIDISDPYKPFVLYRTSLAGGELTDVEVCGGYVAVAFDNLVHPLKGRVFVLKSYDRSTKRMDLLHNITVGSLPDMVKFTKDCRRIVVALEGEMRMIDGQVVDPEGGVAIIKFRGKNPSSPVRVQQANFKRFNKRAEEYVARGVRWVYRGEGTNMKTTFSQDLEPEFVAINADGTIAYIILEENNAVATVDIEKAKVLELYPLGAKPWGGLGMDASDKDGGIHLKSWPIFSLYQPDGVKHFTIGGRGYLVTGNEREEKEYEQPDFPFDFSDGRPGKYFVENDLVDDSVSQSLKDALADDTKLGRLRMSTIDGINPITGKINKFHAYGGRSFSVWDDQDMSLVYDSRDDIERRIAQYYPEVFSSDPGAKDGGPESSMDSCSRKKGPETETLDIGEVNGMPVLFIATERPGIILIYSLPHGDVTLPVFESAHYAGGYGEDWKTLYEQEKTRDVDPEDVKFIYAADSPIGEPLLLVSGTTSGTLSLYKVVADGSCTQVKNAVHPASLHAPHLNTTHNIPLATPHDTRLNTTHNMADDV